MRFYNKLLSVALLTLSVVVSSGCDQDETKSAADNSSKTIRLGVVPGPYRTMVDKHLKSILATKGYSVEFVEFTDYVQPDAALDSGDINANLMQHKKYLDGIVANQGLKIVDVTNVPTLGLGLFSDKYSSIDELPEGARIGIPADAVNLARALLIAKDLKLITLNAENSENKASIADIKENPKKFEFVPMEAAQISRSLDSIDVGFVPGNYAYAANLDYSKALGIEKVGEDIKNVVAVALKDKDTLGKVLHDSVESKQFKDAIENDPMFNSFTRPAWWDSIK